LGAEANVRAMQLAEQLRSDITGLRVVWHCGAGSLKNQMKKADRSGAKMVLILGDDELTQGQVQLKPLHGQGQQQSIAIDQVTAQVTRFL